MCGICGVYGSATDDTLQRMTESLTHRGPDNSETFHDPPLSVGHTRLSIVGLETGDQPIFNEDRSVSVVFNGEIYNYESLRASLTEAGHKFTTKTDTEVLVHLYEDYGTSFVHKLDGMFAFALWDADERQLMLARDQIGIKPLLLADDGETIAFASELPALLESEVNHGGIDRTAIAQYFGFGFVPAPRTAFENVSKLHPGELAVITGDGIKRERYYEPSVSATEPGMENAAAAVRRRVSEAIERRLQSDVPLGAFLSGGIDSSIVVGLLSEVLDNQVQTFTVGFESDRFDEAWAARTVADYHGTDHTEFTVTAGDVREAISSVLNRIGEPFADPSLIPTHVVSRETGREVKVVLSGDGADELFAGYDRYRGEFLSRYYRLLPESMRRRILEPAVNQIPASRGSTVGELGRLGSKFVRGGLDDPCNRHFEWMRIPDENAAATVRGNPVSSGRAVLAGHHERTKEWLPVERQSDLGTMQAVDLGFTLPNQMLHKVDTASMYNSLEVRVPFLDTDVVEYTLGLPTEYKMSALARKRVLKRAFDDILPKEIVERDKQGFDMPIGEWFKDELSDEFRSTVATLETDLLDINGVMAVYEDHVENRSAHGKFLWTVYVFAKWLRRMRSEDIL